MRFTCSTGDAMGMNMVSKGVQNVLDFLQADFPDMDIIGISGKFLLFIVQAPIYFTVMHKQFLVLHPQLQTYFPS
jgi:hypothetical protein